MKKNVINNYYSVIKRMVYVLIPVFAMTCIFLAVSIQNVYGAVSPGASCYVNASHGAYLRKSASVASEAVSLLSDDTKLTVSKVVFTRKKSRGPKYRWYYVYDGRSYGYIRADLVDGIKYTAVAGKITAKSKCRLGAGTKMKYKCTLPKGKAVTVYLKAEPVASTKGSSSTWYKIKTDSGYAYISSANVDIVGSIFVNNTTNDSNKSTPASKTDFAGMTDKQFNSYLCKQGFPASYRTYLKKLHKLHPNWVFTAYKTGLKWDNVLKRESADGVSLVHSSQPLSYRATDSRSYKGSDISIYTSAGGTSSSGKLSSGASVTLNTEIWKGRSRWCGVALTGGKSGYVNADPASESYSKKLTGVINSSSVNIRKGAGTDNPVANTLKEKTKVTIVLRAKDKNGDYWYKILNGSGYAYVKAEFVTLDRYTVTEKTVYTPSTAYPAIQINKKVTFRPQPYKDYPTAGSYKAGEKVTVLSSVINSNGKKWYKTYHNGKVVYVRASDIALRKKVGKSSPDKTVKATVTADALNIRKAPGTASAIKGTLRNGEEVRITDIKLKGSETWYKIKTADTAGYVISDYMSVKLKSAPKDAAPTGEVVTEKTLVTLKPSSLTGKVTFNSKGSYIPKDGSTWFNASTSTVAYYLDPRNFLNESRIYMFEDLSYNGAYQTKSVVSRIISPTRLPGCGFTANLFVNAGSIYGVSPVHLASRARQETGGGSIAISGYRLNSKVVYNPFNIGAYSSSNPVMKGLYYAYNKRWTTQTKAVNGGASFLASSYINRGQNSIYLQRFNVANGEAKVGSHQYMTNIQAPYSEAYSTGNAYKSYKITNEALTFIIPVYSDMPTSTKLP